MTETTDVDVDRGMMELVQCIQQGVMQQSDLRMVIATAYSQAAATAVEVAALAKTLGECPGGFQPAIYRANCVQILRDRIERMRSPQLVVPQAIGRARHDA